MGSGSANYEAAERRRRAFIAHFEEFGSIKDAAVAAGVKVDTYRKWRAATHGFADEVDAIKRDIRDRKDQARIDGLPDPAPHVSNQGLKGGLGASRSEFGVEDWKKASFKVFRKHYFGMDTPDFQMELVGSYENTEPGRITMILLPPEHGKTTLFEDYATWKLAMNPGFRFTVGSESQPMSRKILQRVKLRMDPEGPFPDFVRTWGPFIPQTKGRRATTGNADSGIRQPWGADFFNVYKKRDQDERDYNMVGLGISSQIAGTRTDHLHVDDVMSMNNIGQAASIAQKIRQDWFSRPGQRGLTTFNGTRVAVGDVYEILETELSERVLTVIKMPAIVDRGNGPEPLWPYDETTDSGWTMEMLDRQREIVGEEAWARNYMQKPVNAGSATFNDEDMKAALNPMRSQIHDPDPDDGPIVIGIDPSIGGLSAFAVTQFGYDEIKLLESKQEKGLATNQQIFRVLEELIIMHSRSGAIVSDVIIESMAFQKGLIRDEELERLRHVYGFRVIGHLTNNNKYDENIGVPSMATSYAKYEIDLPYADDARTRFNTDDFIREHLSWRANVSGARLRQDRLMAFWFCWIEWRKRMRIGHMESAPPRVSGPGLGFEPTTGQLFAQGGRYDAA